MTKEQMLEKIYQEIATHIEVYQWEQESWVDRLPVYLGDVLDWQYKTPWIKSWPDTRSEVVENWLNFRESIDNQNDDTISYVYSLIK